jgi:hypothetical protein
MEQKMFLCGRCVGYITSDNSTEVECRTIVRTEQFSMSQHEDSFQLKLEVVNAVTVNISDAVRSTQTRQRIGISRGRSIQEVSR